MTDPTTPATPAGWYPDPSDPSRSRWWDGYQWNEATASLQEVGYTGVPIAPSDASPAALASPESAAPELAAPAEPELAESSPSADPGVPAAPTQAEAPSALAYPSASTDPGSSNGIPPIPPAPGASSAAAGAATPYPVGTSQPSSGSYPASTVTPYPTALAQASQPQQTRSSASVSTVWFWLVVVLPYIPTIVTMFIDWRPLVTLAVNTGANPEAADFVQLEGVLNRILLVATVVSALALIAAALTILFAALDANQLRNRGIDRPFAWGWSAFVLLGSIIVPLSAVYVIGRVVIVRRRTGQKGASVMAPLWTFIALGVVTGIATVVIVSALIAQYVSDLSVVVGTAASAL